MDMVRPPLPHHLRPPSKPSAHPLTQTPSIVISAFGIVILSIIGSMFATGNHAMMGSTENPVDGGKVAAAVFGAVVVYAVRAHMHPSLTL